MIKALIYKDLQMLKTQILSVIIIAALPVMFLCGRIDFVSCTAVFYISSAIVMNLRSLDEKSHWQAYCDTLPISRMQTVLTEFLVMLASCLIQAASIAAFGTVGIHIQGYELSLADYAPIIPGMFVGMAFMSIVIFFSHIFNYNVAMAIYMIICGCFGGMYGLLMGIYADGKNIDIVACLPISATAFYLIASALGIAVTVIMYFCTGMRRASTRRQAAH